MLAPAGSAITLTTATNVLPISGSTEIVAQILENAGTPPHSGTQVLFTATLGTIEPPNPHTDVNGRVTATFWAGATNGIAQIGASSGGPTTGTAGSLTIRVGSAAAGTMTLTAQPASIAEGATAVITARVLDTNGNPLPAVPIIFSATRGRLSASLVSTEANGLAKTVLTTDRESTVTAVAAGSFRRKRRPSRHDCSCDGLRSESPRSASR